MLKTEQNHVESVLIYSQPSLLQITTTSDNKAMVSLIIDLATPENSLQILGDQPQSKQQGLTVLELQVELVKSEELVGRI